MRLNRKYSVDSHDVTDLIKNIVSINSGCKKHYKSTIRNFQAK